MLSICLNAKEPARGAAREPGARAREGHFKYTSRSPRRARRSRARRRRAAATARSDGAARARRRDALRRARAHTLVDLLHAPGLDHVDELAEQHLRSGGARGDRWGARRRRKGAPSFRFAWNDRDASNWTPSTASIQACVAASSSKADMSATGILPPPFATGSPSRRRSPLLLPSLRRPARRTVPQCDDARRHVGWQCSHELAAPRLAEDSPSHLDEVFDAPCFGLDF